MMGQLYSGALREGHRLDAIHPDGTRLRMPIEDWRGPLRPGDSSVLERCRGATLDIGCGPGRIAAALLQRGISAVGIDSNEDAVRLARAAGAVARRCSVFGAVFWPGEWDTALLIDGNIGIGGGPVALLRRVGELLAPGGRVLVEVEGRSGATEQTRLRLASEGRLSRSFPWAWLALRDAQAVAGRADLSLDETWQEAGRWFVALHNA
jgi:SAM-dependent methyltransferase